MTQHEQHAAGEEEQPMPIEPAHVMRREKHQQREHYERMAQEAAKQQE